MKSALAQRQFNAQPVVRRKEVDLRLVPKGFLALIATGTALLMLPAAHRPGHSLGWLDSFFLATSATCVTGLTTVNVAETFNGFDQAVLLALIQLGGLGIFTASISLVLLSGQKLSLADDLQRWLRHEPIAARQTAPWEKAAKWMRRRPALTALLAMTIFSAIAFIAQRLDSEARLKRERDQVTLSERRALAVHFPIEDQPDLHGFEWHHFWARSLGGPAVVLRDHTKPVTCLAFSADGHTLVSGGRDGRIRFWNANDGTPGICLPRSDATGRADDAAEMTALFAVSPEVLALLASGGERFSGASMRSRPGGLGGVSGLALSPDGRWLATGSEGSYVRIWSVTHQQIQFVIPISNSRGLAFTPDGRRLIVGGNGTRANDGEATVKIYDRLSHLRVQSIENVTGHFAIAPDGAALAVARKGRGLEVHELGGGAMPHQISVIGKYACIAYLNDGLRVLDISNPAAPMSIGQYDPLRRSPSAGAEHSPGVGRFTLPGRWIRPGSRRMLPFHDAHALDTMRGASASLARES